MSDERFEEWARKQERLATYRECWQAAIQAERERCAKIAELEGQRYRMETAGRSACYDVADAIRRGEGV